MKRYGTYQPGHTLADEYKAKCALAEKLGDVGLRQWCVEQVGWTCTPGGLDFTKVEALFEYIKGRKNNAE